MHPSSVRFGWIAVLVTIGCGEVPALRASDPPVDLRSFELSANGATAPWTLDTPLPRAQLTLRARIPKRQWADPLLYIAELHGAVEVEAAGERIASAQDHGFVPATEPLLARLPAGAAGTDLVLRITPGAHLDLGPHGRVWIGSAVDLPLELLRRDGRRLVFAVFAISIGTLAFALWLRRRQERSYLALALWAILYGTTIVSTVESRVLLGVDATVWQKLLPVCRAFAPLALLSMTVEFFRAPRAARLAARGLAAIGAVLAALALVALQRTYRFLWMPLNLEWAASTLLSVGIVARAALRGSREARTYLGALAFLGVCVVHDAIVASHYLQQVQWTPLGEAVFLFGLALLVMGRLAQAHDELAVHARELETTNRRLRDVEARLTAALESRDEFLSVASHELRTPMTALLLQVQMMRRAPQPTGVDVLERQVRRLEQLTSDLLDVTRIERGKLELRLEAVDLSQAVAECVEPLRDAARRAGSELRVDGEAGVVGQWDRARVGQVATNLLTNAIKYAAGKPITIVIRRDRARALLEVRDEGPGIPPKDHERIFQRFERAVSSRNYGGLGLGLWISREIVAALHGAIAVESEEGRGATFRVELPLVQPGQAAQAASQSESVGTIARRM